MNLGKIDHIQKLDNTNYETWKIQMKSVLRFNDLWGYVMYIDEFVRIAEQLEECDMKLPENLLSISLLNSLPNDFETMSVAIQSRDKMPSLEELKTKLLEEEARKTQSADESQPEREEEALLSKKRGAYNKGQSKENTQVTQGKKGPKCFNCGKFGHLNRNCKLKVKKKTHESREDAMTAAALNTIFHKKNVWCLDSGATKHMCNDAKKFNELDRKETSRIYTAAENCVNSEGKGEVSIKVQTEHNPNKVRLKETMLVPEFKNNLLSVSSITKNDYEVTFYKHCAIIQMEALLVKNDAWAYVSGETTKPAPIAGDASSEAAIKKWESEDRKAKSDIILSISPAELKQIKGCNTSSDVWSKLRSIYQSKGPARKATLLKRLTVHRMEDGADVRGHLRNFFDTIDKLSEMDVEINPDLLTIMLLYSLPPCFENFRCAIESRDELPTPEALRIKIVEESDARKNDARMPENDAMIAHDRNSKRWNKKTSGGNGSKNDGSFKYKCYRCRKVGHKPSECTQSKSRGDGTNKTENAKRTDSVSLYISPELLEEKAMITSRVTYAESWCLDSGCTSHMCRDENVFVQIAETKTGRLNLASHDSTEIAAKGTVEITAKVDGLQRDINLSDTLHVPDLRTNLLSIGKIADKGFKIIFEKGTAEVIDKRGTKVLTAERNNGLYYLRQDLQQCNSTTEMTKTDDELKLAVIENWHRRMGHLNFRDLLESSRRGIVRGIKVDEYKKNIHCEVCVRGKMTRAPFPRISDRSTDILDIIHSDVRGPMRTESNGKARYFITFVDDYSRWCEVRLMRGKDEALTAFKEFKVFSLNREPTKGKFEPRSKKGIFLGYSEQSKAYRVWLPDERRVDIARDVKFLEGKNEFPDGEYIDFSPEDSAITEPETVDFQINSENKRVDVDGAVEDEREEREQIVGEELNHEPPENEPRRARGRPRLIRTGLKGRPRKEYQIANYVGEETELAHVAEIPFNEAVGGPDSNEWRQAMVSEMKSIIMKDTWTLVDHPKDRQVIGSRVVLRNKYSQDGHIERRKARVVARGFTQCPGIDFNETFAPVARLSSIRLMMALAAQHEMKVPKLTEEILEEISLTETMNGELGTKARNMLKSLREGNRVCLLNKALYGLRQAGRRWHETLGTKFKELGFVPSAADPCVFYSGEGEDIVMAAVYVDDILVASRNEKAIEDLMTHLSKSFEIRNLGEVKYCLGIEFSRLNGEIVMNQKGYINDILCRFHMTNSNPVATPLDPGSKLKRNEGALKPEEKDLPYRELIGTLMYLAVCSRPDIAHAVSYLSQYCNYYDGTHWTAAKRVLRYLKGTSHIGLRFKKNAASLTGYVDADWANCLDDRRSYTGYVFSLGECPISWESRKQRTVALSSTEAEYMALTEAAKEAIYLRRFLLELGFARLAVVKVFSDNHGALKLGENPVFHNRTKHIDTRHHFIRETLKNGFLKVEYKSTDDMAADILTKGLSGPKHKRCLEILSIEGVGMPN
ncbi:hypothetical protein KPH14_001023 [Odynerus spinipes]|uniref:CCHC-type domain-containing protein n=1 Tax=Odynerus spinipes TaxID=1348599 RepID=A0AAD9RF48_9HYME|nr:hypothetical protein KPH14_001023 [Odynerus spinipes]